MKIEITKRVDLNEIIKNINWEGTYILVKVFSMNEIKEVGKETTGIENKIKKLEKELKKHEKINEENYNEQTEQYIEELQKQIDELSENRLNMLTGWVKERFVSGIAFDSETQSKQELKVEDLDQFPSEVITKIIQIISGTGEKKS
jgi:DNA integrity scanning protein DisA with diadenylate cyclase activity